MIVTIELNPAEIEKKEKHKELIEKIMAKIKNIGM